MNLPPGWTTKKMALTPDELKSVLQVLQDFGVQSFKDGALEVTLYPGGISTSSLSDQLPSGRRAVADAIETAKRSLQEEESDLFWST
jgi:hypothetical protein